MKDKDSKDSKGRALNACAGRQIASRDIPRVVVASTVPAIVVELALRMEAHDHHEVSGFGRELRRMLGVSSDLKVDELGAAMTGIAQGVINISEGHTTIEPESRVHRAMSCIVELYSAGRIAVVEPTK